LATTRALYIGTSCGWAIARRGGGRQVNEVAMADVERIIVSAYEVANENTRREALAWLREFEHRDEAWSICLQLLKSSSQRVQFFASNMLYKKCGADWHDQSDRFKEELRVEVVRVIQDYVQNDNSGVWGKAAKFLCLVLARVSTRATHFVESFIAETTSLLQIGLNESGTVRSEMVRDRALFLCAELLIALPEERDIIEEDTGPQNVTPDSIGQKMLWAEPSVLKTIIGLLQRQNSDKHVARAFDILEKWHVNMAAVAQAGLLKPALIAINSSENSYVIESACRALVASVEAESKEQILGQQESDQTRQAFDLAIEGVLSCSSRVQNDFTSRPESVTLHFCKVVVAIVEHEIQRVTVGETPEVLRLVELVMAFTGHKSHNVAIVTLNIWLLIQDVPVSERHESLREPCFVKLLQVLLQQSKLEPDAASGYDDDINFEQLSFRTSHDGVKGPLENTFHALGSRFLETILDVLRRATDWESFEAALFALVSASGAIVSHTSSQGLASSGPRGPAIRAVLDTILVELPGMPMLGTNGATLRIGAVMVGSFAKILASMPNSLIERHLEFLLQAMSYAEPVSISAALSFQSICVACRLELALNPTTVHTLLAGVESAFRVYPRTDPSRSALQSSQVPRQVRLNVARGLSRVVAVMAVGERRKSIGLLLEPGLERLRQAIAQSNTTVVADELCAIEIAVRFVETSTSKGAVNESHPAAAVLQSTLPLLDQIFSNEALRTDNDVVDALFDLISTSFSSAPQVLAPHLESLLRTCVEQFSRTWSPCCIKCVGKAVEVYVPSNPDLKSGFVQIFSLLVDAMVRAIQEGKVSENPVIVSQFFDTALLFVLFCPSSLLSKRSDQSALVIDTMLQLCAKCISSDDATCSRSVIHFVGRMQSKMAMAGPSDHEFKQYFDAAFQRQGGHLVEEILRGLAKTAPQSICPRLARIFSDFVACYGPYIQDVAYTALLKDQATYAPLSAECKEALVSALPNMRSYSAKMEEIFVRFSKVCRKQEPSSSLALLIKNAEEINAALSNANLSSPAASRVVDSKGTFSPVIDLS